MYRKPDLLLANQAFLCLDVSEFISNCLKNCELCIMKYELYKFLVVK
jgi:hypothetical protein